MQNPIFGITALVAATMILGCSEKTDTTRPQVETLSTSNGVVDKSVARAAMIRSLEGRVSKDDADAQLALAKLLMDGNEVPVNFERAKELLVSASAKGLSEAMLGLNLLRSRKLIVDASLPDAATLAKQAEDTQDPFVNTFFYHPSSSRSKGPPALVVKLAANGYPLANAKMAQYYGQALSDANKCKKRAAILKTLKQRQSVLLDLCSYASSIPDASPRAIAFATEILNSKEADADKLRYWTSFLYRQKGAKAGHFDASTLLQMQFGVAQQADPYSSTLAKGLSEVGRALKDDADSSRNGSEAELMSQLLKRAAELGDADAQNAMGELFQSGRGVPQDFEMAARYFAQSAQQAEGNGARNLALAFARGQGVEKNDVRAYFWLSVGALGTAAHSEEEYMKEAAQSGDLAKRARAALMVQVEEESGEPAALRNRAARALTREQIAEGQRLVRAWKPSHQNGPPPAISTFDVASRGTNGSDAAAASGTLSKKSSGTVFFVSATGHAVTNQHVIEGCTELRVEGRDGLAKRVTEDVVNDLALIQIPGSMPTVAPIAGDSKKLRQGEDIVVYGFPLSAVLSSGGNLTPGVVSALTGIGNNTNQIQITAAIQPGSSGSPVINKKGEVVGVVSMKLSDSKMAKATGSVGQNVNFAVNGQTLKTFLDTHNVAYRNGAGLFSWEKSTADLADEARKWTLVLECWK